jgi:AcrR family transcriptional regulator
LEAEAPIRQRIIEAAGVIFAERGYRDTTVRDIAAAANVNLAGVSYHFGGKQQLYVATVEVAQQSRIDAATFAVPDREATPDEQLRSFIRALLSRLLDRAQVDWKSRLLARELTSPTEFCFPQIARWYRPIFEGLMRIVEGVVGRPLDEPQRTLVGFSIVGQCLFYRISAETVRIFVPSDRSDGFDLVSLADHISDFTLAGLASLREGRS